MGQTAGAAQHTAFGAHDFWKDIRLGFEYFGYVPWDLDRNLDNFQADLRIFLVETNGLPNLSDGFTPDSRSLDYGQWASQILDGLGIMRTFVAGASFGALVCAKLSIVSPDKIKAAFWLNPGNLQPFSPSWKNLYLNLLPIANPTRGNVWKFLDGAIFCKPEHHVSVSAEELLADYEVFALKRYCDKTQKPYFMGVELQKVKTPTYLLLGESDLLFPFEKSVRNAQKFLPDLIEAKVFLNVGHGIETYAEAMRFIGQKIQKNH